MKCIITGATKLKDYSIVTQAIYASEFALAITEVVCCDNYGVDKFGEQWANEHKLPVKHYPIKWNDLTNSDAIIRENPKGKYDARAGFRNNDIISEYADAAIVITQNDNRGIDDLIEKMHKLDKKVYIWEV